MIALVAALSLVLEPAATEKTTPSIWNPPTLVETIPLVAAHALIACDVLQTLKFRSRGVPERNPFLGRYPSNAKVIFVGGILPVALLTVAWYALPSGWRIFAPAAVVGAETVQVIQNVQAGYTP